MEATTGTFTQSPTSTLASVLWARAQNYILGPQDPSVQTIAQEGVNEGIYKLNARKWNWARFSQPITLAANVQEYALNASFKASRACETLNSAGEVNGQLPWIDPKNFDDMFYDRSSPTNPIAYTIFNVFDNGKLTLSYNPPAGFVATYPTLRVRYWRRTPILNTGTDVFTGPSEFEPFLVWTARATLASIWAPSKYAVAKRSADELWGLLRRDDVLLETGDW